MSSRETRTPRDAVGQALRDPEHAPLGAALDTDLPEGSVPEIWHRIDARLSFAERARPWRITGALLAAAALVLVVVGGFWMRRAPAPTALALENGVSPTTLNATAQAGSFVFADGSRIEVAPQTELRVVKNDARTLVTALGRGRTTFDVRPGGPRRWLIEAGPATVEVVGTRFTVHRTDGSVRVEVERGIVLVRGEAVAGGRVRLTAGQSVVVTKPAAPAATPAATSGAASALPATPPPAPSVAVAPSLTAAPVALSALPAVAASPAPAKPAASAAPDAVDRALAAADAARRRGDRVEAAQAFEVALDAARPSDKRRGLAALSLARLVLRSDPARAARVLRDAFAAMPVDLVEDALARRVEAEGRAGRREEAARLAAEYERRFPEGQRSSEVKRWSAQ
jgi:transmembrane sensor